MGIPCASSSLALRPIARREEAMEQDARAEVRLARNGKMMARKRKRNAGSRDWRMLAAVLSTIRDSQDLPRRGTTVYLRKRTIEKLTTMVAPNMWIHHAGTGCEVHVLQKTLENEDLLQVVLCGSSRATELTREDLLAAEAQRTLPPEDGGPGGKDAQSREPTRSETWSVRSFAQYVSDLVSMDMPRLMSWDKLRGRQTRNEHIAMMLRDLFFDPSASKYASVGALNTALHFLCPHSDLMATTFWMYSRATELNLKPDITTFNHLIGGALKTMNTEFLYTLVSDMQARGVVPDGWTWAILGASLASRPDRREFLSTIQQQGVRMNVEAMTFLTQAIVKKDFVMWAKSPATFLASINRMDEIWGLGWLSPPTCNQMIHQCGKYKKWDIAGQLLALARERSIHLDTRSQKYFLQLHVRRNSLEDSLPLLEQILAEDGRRHDKMIHLVFMAAWRRRCYNLCRLLWRYAATHGTISYIMYNIVTRSLVRGAPEQNSRSHIWRSLAGKVIVGTDLDTTDFHSHFPLLCQLCSSPNPMEWLAFTVPEGESREEQLKLAYVLMHRDLNAWKYFKPMSREKLFELLNGAYQMDREWISSRLSESVDRITLMDRAIDVRLEKLSDPDRGLARKESELADAVDSISASAPWRPMEAVLEDQDQTPSPAEAADTKFMSLPFVAEISTLMRLAFADFADFEVGSTP